MDLQLRDRVIIVTGGANGIGLGISGMLAAEGTQMRQIIERAAAEGKLDGENR